MLKILAKIQEIISCDVIYNLIATVSFYSREDHQKFNMAKSKVIFSKTAGNRQVLLCKLHIW